MEFMLQLHTLHDKIDLYSYFILCTQLQSSKEDQLNISDSLQLIKRNLGKLETVCNIMGNQGGKPEQANNAQPNDNQPQPNKDKNDEKKNLAISNVKNVKEKNESNPNTQRGKNGQSSMRKSPQMSFRNMGNNSNTTNKRDAQNQTSLNREKNNNTKISKQSANSKGNYHKQNDIELYDESKDNNEDQQDENHNQFMPLMKLQPVGQIRLKISLVELSLELKPKPHLKKKTSSYNSVMQWKKNPNNIFNFVVKEDQSYELKMDVDIQGNTLNNKDEFWCALCPINIPFGQTVKVGQMICVNWYQKLQNQDEDDDEEESKLGPSIKNIDFKVSEDTFGKWGEKIPKNFYDEHKSASIKQIYQKPTKIQKFEAYKQLSRYFDSRNIWRATTFYQETQKYFRNWIIQVSDHNSVASISKQLHSDLKNRQSFYEKTMYQMMIGSQKSLS